MAAQSELGDYKLYTLPEPTTVAANQTKQVRFLGNAGAAYRRVYSYHVAAPLRLFPQMSAEPREAEITLKLVNAKSQGLGEPLPSGHVVFMAPAAGQELFVGEDRIEDTPTGADLTLKLGRSPLVSVDTQVLSAVKRLHVGQTLDLAVTATNASPEAATIDIRQDGGLALNVQTEDHPHTLKNGDPCWTLTVPAGGQEVLHYSLIKPH